MIPTDKPMQCPALGRETWTLLHTTAAYYPDRPAPSQMESMKTFIRMLIDNYPCDNQVFRETMETHPIRVGSRKKLSEWLCERHNNINQHLGKEPFDCSKVFERWMYGDPQCNAN